MFAPSRARSSGASASAFSKPAGMVDDLWVLLQCARKLYFMMAGRFFCASLLPKLQRQLHSVQGQQALAGTEGR